ncbi:NUDIX hydrolase [Acidobacteria bacterium AH-259-A15]|nr:NUDIX hydrolase [Acidobacteria bacterium AH-259-A15]
MQVNRKHLYSGKIVDLIVDTIEVKGKQYIREVVRHPGGVVILAQLEDGRIPFVRQLRYPMDKVLLELPAGKLDPGEEPEVSARRELEEETGLRAEFLKHIFSFYPTPGFCDEFLHLYYTNRVQETSTNLEQDEDIVVEFYRLEEAIDMSLRGEIIDAKTLLALFWLYWKKLRGAEQ